MGNTGMVYHPPAWFRERMILIMTVEISLIAYFVVYRSNSEINRNLFGKEWLDTHPLVKELGRKSGYCVSGHVHAYERSERISNIVYKVSNGNCTPVLNSSAPVYITIGDGGNIEGLANKFTEPQPSYSAYREASFGHAMLEIKNQTHAFYSWHRNQDSEAVLGDSQWFYNRQWYPHEESSTAGTVA
ncbi:hypothetical protein IFM89_037567 [Coptis chinensis]|uniref:Purple acid phosphatase C-terminal domain-containing protein n=1 Tax=Coptis chinensis TaxID=261450 RepID=A0A835HZD6_9MAGN|nr:hypothetical protein IFM89_037567 [Coptis chinensis]